MYKGAALSYKRFDREYNVNQKEKLNLYAYQYLLLYVAMFFISRVFLLKTLMPFGIAFFSAIFTVLDKKSTLLLGIISILGYLSTSQEYLSYSHVITLLCLMVLMFFIKDSKNKILKISILASLFNMISSMFFHIKYITKGFLAYDLFLALLESLMILTSCYIFAYGMPAFLNSKKRKVFSKEELICFALLFSGIVSGIWDIKYFNMSLKNIIGFFLVLFAGYVKGAETGATIGAAIGFMISISDAKMPIFVGIYAICGLISGVFREVGKIVTCIAFVASSILFYLYTINFIDIDIVFLDTLIPCAVFMLIPKRVYDRVSDMFDREKRMIELQKSYIERIKDVTGLKLKDIFNTVSALSKILEENVNNELSKKSEINELVEKLAYKVCTNCVRKNLCWDKELYYTYNSYNELLRYIEKKGTVGPDDLPVELKKKCQKPTELSREANHLLEILRINNRWRNKIINSRKIVAEQTKGVSELVRTMMEEVATSVEFKNDIEEEIAVALDRKGLEFDDVLAIKNSRGKFEVTIYRKPCSGKQLCSKEYGKIISKTLGVNMEKESTNCSINKKGSMCQFRFVEAVNYSVVTAVSKLSKEKISGDSYTFGNIGKGRYMVALSDGMGSGAIASNESKTTITLLEEFIEAGFERNTAIKAINSVLVLRSCDECFATIDMSLIDLYSGIGEFIKIGSAPTFIKSGLNIDIVKSMSIPIGILDDIDIESQIIQLKNGDMIITVSDGVIDSSSKKEKWLMDIIIKCDSGNPKDVADYILHKAKENYGNEIGDDMTVIVTKIWKNI